MSYSALLSIALTLSLSAHAEGIWSYIPFVAQESPSLLDQAKAEHLAELKAALKGEMVGNIPADIYKLYRCLRMQEDIPQVPSNKYLLYGPSGVGKTAITADLAKVTGAQYKVIRSSSLVTPYQGSASRTIEYEVEQAAQRAEETRQWYKTPR